MSDERAAAVPPTGASGVAAPVFVDDPDDPRLADFVALTDPEQRRRRERDEFLVVEGPVALAKLVESQLAIRTVLTTERRLERVIELVGSAAPVVVVGADVMRATVGFDLHRGIVASAARPAPLDVEALAERAVRRGRSTVVALEGLNDFENVGLIVRTAAAFGVAGLVLDPTCLDPYYRRSVRVSMGEVLRTDIARAVEWPGDLEHFRRRGFEVWALTPAADAVSIWELEVPDRVVMLAGAEGPGLGDPALAAADRRVVIPVAGAVGSLNVGHATAAALAVLGRPAAR